MTAASDAARLLGVHPGALGDVILFGHLLGALRGDGQRIALAAGGEKAKLLAALGVVDDAIDIESLGLHDLFTDEPIAPDAPLAHRGRCRRLITCFGDDRIAPRWLAACGAERMDVLPVRPVADQPRHLLETWADLLGIPAPLPIRPWSTPDTLRTAAAKRLAGHGVQCGTRFLAIHVGGGAVAKCWPVDRFVDLADRLDLPAVFLAGPVERERLAPADFQRLCDAGPVLDNLTLTELAGLLTLAAAFVGNDSGPAHLAAAVGTPVVALFGPTDPVHFAPMSSDPQSVRILRHTPLVDLPVSDVAAAVADKCH